MIRIESLGTISSNLYLTERIVVCNFLVFPPGATKKASSFSLALFTGTKIQPDRYFRLFEEIKDRTRRQPTDNRAPVCSAICARFSRHIISASYLLCVCVFVCLCVCFFSFSARLPWNPFYFLHLCLPLFLSLTQICWFMSHSLTLTLTQRSPCVTFRVVSSPYRSYT